MNFLIDVSFGEDYELYPDKVLIAAGMDRLSDLRDRYVREVPAVENLSDHSARQFLATTMRDAMRKRERLWIIPMTEKVRAEWSGALPNDVLIEIGPKQMSDGKEIVPMGVAPVRLIEEVLHRNRPDELTILRRALHGVDGLAFSSRVYHMLIDAGVQILPRGRLTRIVTNPRFIAYAIVLVYSSLRALVVTFVPSFEGSMMLLWAIDLITAIPYTWGIIAMVTAPRFRIRALGMIVTIVTFLAPYIYFGSVGDNYPIGVWIVIGCLVLGTFVLEGYKWWSDQRVSRSLKAGAPTD